MKFKNLFTKETFKKADSPFNKVEPTYDENGLVFSTAHFSNIKKSTNSIKNLYSYLQQLEEEGYAKKEFDHWKISWETVYQFLDSDNHKELESQNFEDHKISFTLLNLPKLSAIRPEITGIGSLSDHNFSVSVKKWLLPSGKSVAVSERKGAVIYIDNDRFLMPESSWYCWAAIKSFHNEKRINPGEQTNKKYWSEIRKYAKRADAVMDTSLEKTIVIKPEQLKLKLNKTDVLDDKVIQIAPDFEEQPANWIKTFDQYDRVRDQYDVLDEDGSINHIVIDPDVKEVLETVKSIKGRYVAGDKSLLLIKNPYMVLGESAQKVIDEHDLESQIALSGITFYKFHLEPNLNDDGSKITDINLSLTSPNDSTTRIEYYSFKKPGDFQGFINDISLKVESGLPCCKWKKFDLELSDVHSSMIDDFQDLSNRWFAELDGQVFNDVLDLTQYGDRVIGIGEAKVIKYPFIKKEIAEQWISLIDVSELGFDTEILSKWDDASYFDLVEFKDRIQQSKLTGESVALPGIELSMTLRNAELFAQIWEEKYEKGQSHESESAGVEKNGKKPRSILLLEDNKETVTYIESRAEELHFDEGTKPVLPNCIRPEIELKEHQLRGVAWLQNLLNKAPTHVTGCLLADDMGLGKTLQLLTFILEYLERDEESKPCLVVAPVSLLDNWEKELNKFFNTNIELKKLYGKTLSDAKYKKNEIPEDLKNRGIGNVLHSDWLGGAKIVLTTYETLRDQQFSLAQQQWGIVVCDEAQKIKTPGTFVTMAASAVASKAHFKIACTGTPVENTLMDLWCLFDFFQQDYLGKPNEFALKFKKRIECNTEQDNFAIDLLRKLIDPQTLRRLKSDVAKDLPKKIEDKSCQSLRMSQHQEKLYQKLSSDYQQSKEMREKMGEKAGAEMLGLLHNLKMVCAHPVTVSPDINSIKDSPKLIWLISALKDIQKRNEKVIIFTELRQIQRDLQMLILEHFDYEASIINGDTNSSSERGINRQGIIDEFQSKQGFGVIILSTTAVGFGVNVQEANHVIHFTRPWNPAKEDQATDRAYRIGQTKDVYVYYPTVTSANCQTFEEKLHKLLSEKRELADDILNGYDDIHVADLI